MEMLERLKLRLDIKNEDDDALLNELILEAKEHILGYTRRNESQWLSFFDGTCVKIALINYGRMGMEGVQSRGEGGISTTFSADYPESITKILDPHRLIKGG